MAQEGARTWRDEAAEEFLAKQNAKAMYIPGQPGKPGVLVFSRNATRAEVLEEIKHMKQHKSLKFASLSTEQIIKLEIEAQQQLSRYAKMKGWSDAEIKQFDDNLEYWKAKQAEYAKGGDAAKAVDAEVGGFRMADEHPEGWVEVTNIRTKILNKVNHVIRHLDINSSGTGFKGCHSKIAIEDFLAQNPGSRVEYREISYDLISGSSDSTRVYEVTPVVILNNGTEIGKINNDGVSSFFPDDWDEAKILNEVEHAIANNHGKIPEKPNGNEYYGFSSDGLVRIHFYLDTNGNVGSYFPKKR